MPRKSISSLILEYFKTHPNEDLEHGPVVDWVEAERIRLGGTKPRDPWRDIRKLHERGILIEVKKGVYKYDPNHVKELEQFDFPPAIKEQIFKQDNYSCVVCGMGRKNKIEICADHIIAKDRGGTNTLDNGQTLCMKHNNMKKNYSQTEAGKRYFIKMYQRAVALKDEKMTNFCKGVFDTYDKHDINSHIPRPNGNGQSGK